MNNSKGFTLLEMLVAAGLLVIALAGAMSFFIYQSTKGSDATTIKVARENLSLALMLIQRDMLAAGYGVMGGAMDPKTLTVVLTTNYGVDNVTGNQFNSKVTMSTPDKLHVGYGTFLDMNFDVNGTNDPNSVFKYTATKNIGSAALSTFVYDLFPAEMDVNTNNKPVGGFICGTCAGGQPGAGDVDWKNTASKPVGTKTWTVKIQSGMSPLQSSLSDNVAPAIVYRIAQDSNRLTQELQRNGVRIAGGDPRLEVYNLKVVDESSPNKRSFSIRIDYQVKLGGSQDETAVHGTGKNSWYKGYVTIKADPRVIILNGG